MEKVNHIISDSDKEKIKKESEKIYKKLKRFFGDNKYLLGKDISVPENLHHLMHNCTVQDYNHTYRENGYDHRTHKFTLNQGHITRTLQKEFKEKHPDKLIQVIKEVKEVQRNSEDTYSSAFWDYKDETRSFKSTLYLAKQNDDTELVNILQNRLDGFAKKEVEITVDLLDDASLYAMTKLYDCNKEELVEILYKAKSADLSKDNQIQEVVQVEQETEVMNFVDEDTGEVVSIQRPKEKASPIATKTTTKRNGTKVKQVIEAALKQEPNKEWYNNGKLVKSKVYKTLPKVQERLPIMSKSTY